MDLASTFSRCFWVLGLVLLSVITRSQTTLQQTHQNYYFTGNGNWSLTSNWLQNKKPPGFVPKGDTIFIQSTPGDTCVLDVAQYLAEGAVLKVVDEARLIIKGDVLNFVPADATFKDSRDGQVYPIKKYGNQVWMTMNLNFNQSGSKFYENNPGNAATYGRLYTWDQAIAAVPAGWRLPTRDEWRSLVTFLGGAGPMKDTLFWYTPNAGATNSSSFSLRPGGIYDFQEFEDLGYFGLWWTSTEHSELGVKHSAYYLQAGYNVASISSDFYLYKKVYMISVRCIKN